MVRMFYQHFLCYSENVFNKLLQLSQTITFSLEKKSNGNGI